MLYAAHISCADDLHRLSFVSVFAAFYEADRKPTINLLWVLESALRKQNSAKVPEVVRAKVKNEIDGPDSSRWICSSRQFGSDSILRYLIVVNPYDRRVERNRTWFEHCW